MSRIIWRRRGVEWVGRLTKDGPDRFRAREVRCNDGVIVWELTDLESGHIGITHKLSDAQRWCEMVISSERIR